MPDLQPLSGTEVVAKPRRSSTWQSATLHFTQLLPTGLQADPNRDKPGWPAATKGPSLTATHCELGWPAQCPKHGKTFGGKHGHQSLVREISQQLKTRSLGCQKPKLKRFSYKHHTEQSGWADYKMPITPVQADALFCEFMPDERDERAWLPGSSDVRVVEVGWTALKFSCAILRTLYKPRAGRVPDIWEMA
eukprot:1093891-Amphidinium_carterae.1